MGPGTAAVGQAAGTSLPFTSLAVEDELGEHPLLGGDCSAGGSLLHFVSFFTGYIYFLDLPEPASHPSTLQTGVERASGSLRLVPPPLVLPRSPLAQEVHRQQVECCLRNLNAATAKLPLPRRWGPRVE